MRRKYSELKFVKMWVEAYNKDKPAKWVSEGMGMPTPYMSTFKYKLTKKGVKLPPLPLTDKEITVEQLNEIIEQGIKRRNLNNG